MSAIIESYVLRLSLCCECFEKDADRIPIATRDAILTSQSQYISLCNDIKLFVKDNSHNFVLSESCDVSSKSAQTRNRLGIRKVAFILCLN